MTFGGERAFLQETTLRSFLWRVRGDFHIGRWMRYFYLKQGLNKVAHNPKQILDAGCGEGAVTFYLGRRFPDSHIDGIDLEPANIALCKRTETKISNGHFSFRQADLQAGGLEKKYDLAVINNVLYAVPDYKKAAKALIDALSAGGYLVLQDMVLAHNPKEHTIADAVRMGFDPSEIETFLKQNQMNIVVHKKTFGVLGNLSHRGFSKVRNKPWLGNLFFPFLLFIGYLDTLFPVLEGSGFLIVAQKMKSAGLDL